MAFGVGIEVAAVEVVCGADAPERTEGGAHVLMVARGQDAPAAPAESRDPLTVGGSHPVPCVERKEPQLVERRTIERRQHRIVLTWSSSAVARGHVEARSVLPRRGEVLGEQREAA